MMCLTIRVVSLVTMAKGSAGWNTLPALFVPEM
jgi:hypothetical protein